MGSSVILPPPGQPATGPDPAFKSASIPNVVTFIFKGIAPPPSLYVQKDDQVQFTGISNQANEVVVFNIRFLRLEVPLGGQPDHPPADLLLSDKPVLGTIIEFQQAVPVTLGRAGNTLLQQVGEGFILSLLATATVATTRGQTFAKATIFRGLTGTKGSAQVFFSDYVSNFHAASWPGGNQRHVSEGPGFLHSIQQANPAAGADWVFTVPANSRMRPVTLEAQLAVANSGAARPIEIIVDDGVNIVARMATNAAAPINATANVNFSTAGTPSTSIASDLYAQQPAGMILPPGFRIRSVTTNIVAGDAWTNIWFLMEEWLDQ